LLGGLGARPPCLRYCSEVQ